MTYKFEAIIPICATENKYKEMMDDIDYMKEYKYNLNKVYILLGELKNSIYSEEINLSKMKYINFEELKPSR